MSFYYYGSKSNLARLYPPPRYDVIIEPFAGAGAYSVYHLLRGNARHAVLIEKSKTVCEAWEWIRSHTPEEIMKYPRPVVGSRTSDFFHKMLSASNAALSCGEMTVTWRMVEVFDSMLRRMARTRSVMDMIEVVNDSYENAPDDECTWFVDPPYQVTGSSRNGNGYEKGCRASDIDYASLAAFCRSRRGQVIVCEKEGASWLPFWHLTDSRNTANGTYSEVVWMNGVEGTATAGGEETGEENAMSYCERCDQLREGNFCEKHGKPLSKCAGGCAFNRTGDRPGLGVKAKEATQEQAEALRSMTDRVVCGDCLEEMRKLPDDCIDVIVTSPPYNLRNSTGGSWKTPPDKMDSWLAHGKSALHDGYDNYSDDMPYDQYVRWQNECLKEMVRIIKPTGFIFYNHKQRVQAGLLQHRMDIMEGLPLRQVVQWLRNGCGTINYNEGYFMFNCEQIFVLAKSNKARMPKHAYQYGMVWQIAQDTSKSDDRHPAPFPVELPDKCLDSQYLTPDSIVLDPFIGGGTTAVSAVRHGVHFIGFDVSQKYCEIAERRIAAARREVLEGRVFKAVADLYEQIRPKLEKVVLSRPEFAELRGCPAPAPSKAQEDDRQLLFDFMK